MEQPAAQDILHHRQTRSLLKQSIIMEQGKAYHIRQFLCGNLRLQILLNIINTLLDDPPIVHSFPSFRLFRSCAFIIAQKREKSISILAVFIRNPDCSRFVLPFQD